MFLSFVIFLCPSLSWVSLTSTGFGLVTISSCFPVFLIAPSPTFFLLLFLVSGCYCPFLHSYCSALPWISISSSLGSFGYLFSLFLHFFFSGFPLFAGPFVAATYVFLLLYPSVSFVVYTSHFSCLILFWIVASIVYSLSPFL